ncbi:switch-associated protein 70 isoform X1 [Canna indica]|uniref:Switch-associated protein 70 isoform X1 n=1 Tax=Canna indica TaxID=4628 RepID=A0AAQ3K0L7_9LILI|nr:switch-associated protein 70 isoform X1 [Canna indica]
MEEYLVNVKRLRSQMNDIEEAAAKRSMEEQQQKTAIAALESDLNHVRGESKRLSDDAEEMLKVKASIGSEIMEKQKKISLLETECCTLSQTLELLQQERTTMLLQLKEKRSYYTRVTEELNLKVQERQVKLHYVLLEWYNSYMQKMTANVASGEDCLDAQVVETKVHHDETSERDKDMATALDSAKTKIDELKAKMSEIVEDRVKSKKLLEELNNKLLAAPQELREMDFKVLEEEQSSLMVDKAGEQEYLQSLEQRINQLKNISYVINCQCGKEYKVELGG